MSEQVTHFRNGERKHRSGVLGGLLRSLRVLQASCLRTDHCKACLHEHHERHMYVIRNRSGANYSRITCNISTFAEWKERIRCQRERTPCISICLRQGTKPYHERYVRTQVEYVEYSVYVKDPSKRVEIMLDYRYLLLTVTEKKLFAD